MKRTRAAWLGGLLMTAWLTWSGHYNVLMVALGAASCALVLTLSLRMKLLNEIGLGEGALRRLPEYLFWLANQIILANLDVARRILDPRLPISPSLVRIKTQPRTEVGRAILGNSISLTPGTVTVRLRSGVALVHALTSQAAADVVEGEMNRRVAALERGKPC